MAAMSSTARVPKGIKGVVFDMDGTLTLPTLINFPRIRQRTQCPKDVGLIEHANSQLSEEAKRRVWDIIEEEETIAAEKCELQPGYKVVMERLEKLKIPKALVTRNSLAAVNAFQAKAKTNFSVTLTRDWKGGFKPSPEPLLHILRQWGLSAKNVIVVGDARDDLAMGSTAGAYTALMLNDDNQHLKPKADVHLNRLDEILAFVDTQNNTTDATALPVS